MSQQEPVDLYFRRNLSDPIPPVVLLDGYNIITATEQNGRLWERVMDKAFGGYEPGDFRYVMVWNFGYEEDRVFLLTGPDGEPVATASSWWQPYKWGDPGIGEVIFVGVAPKARGQGLARQMVNHVLHDMARRGMHTASLSTWENNLSAIKTYLNCGFLPYLDLTGNADVWELQFRALDVTAPGYDRTTHEIPDVPHPKGPYPYALRMEKEATARGDVWVHGRWIRHNMLLPEPAQYAVAETWFRAIDGASIRLASINENGSGAVYLNNALNPSSAFMLADDGFGYLAGSADCPDFIDGVVALLMGDIMPAKAPDDRQVILFSSGEQWNEALDRRLAPYHGLRIRRHTFRFDRDAFQQTAAALPPLPDGYELRNRESSAYSVGIWKDGEEVAHCAEAFSGDGAVELDVFTAEEHRRLGLALHACAASIHRCISEGMTPHWSCWDYNEPSVQLALRLGFRQLPDLIVNFRDLCGR